VEDDEEEDGDDDDNCRDCGLDGVGRLPIVVACCRRRGDVKPDTITTPRNEDNVIIQKTVTTSNNLIFVEIKRDVHARQLQRGFSLLCYCKNILRVLL
jgi:hypothetical protein